MLAKQSQLTTDKMNAASTSVLNITVCRSPYKAVLSSSSIALQPKMGLGLLYLDPPKQPCTCSDSGDNIHNNKPLQYTLLNCYDNEPLIMLLETYVFRLIFLVEGFPRRSLMSTE